MTELEILRKVELPLAIPTLMAGVRWRTIAIVATATIAPLAGVLPSATSSSTKTSTARTASLAGAIVVALMALTLELLLALLQRRLTSKGLKLEPRLRLVQPTKERKHRVRTKTTRERACAGDAGWRSS